MWHPKNGCGRKSLAHIRVYHNLPTNASMKIDQSYHLSWTKLSFRSPRFTMKTFCSHHFKCRPTKVQQDGTWSKHGIYLISVTINYVDEFQTYVACVKSEHSPHKQQSHRLHLWNYAVSEKRTKNVEQQWHTVGRRYCCPPNLNDWAQPVANYKSMWR